MRLFKYLDFLLESRGDVKVPCVISESFIRKCKKIDSPVSKALIDMDRKMSHYTFIDDNLDGEHIQYTESERVIDILKKMYKYTEVDEAFVSKYLTNISNPEPDSKFWNSNRIDIRVGKFVRRFLVDKFSDSQIEDFVNKWKSLKDMGEKFEFWSSSIPDAYITKNYVGEYAYNPLWNSCMNDRTDLVDFYLYIKDLEVVVLLDPEDKILGRALLWTDVEGRKFLDRVYYIKDKDYYKFVNLAKESGWYYKKRNISGGSTWIINGEEKKIQTKIKFPLDALNHIEDEWGNPKFPYVDSFYFLDDKGGYLMNYEPNNSYYVLNDTDGQYEYYSDVYDVHGNRVGDEDDYIYSKTQGGLVSLYNSIRVEYDGFDDYIEIKYLEDPKNGFVYFQDEDEWYKKEDFEKMKSSK